MTETQLQSLWNRLTARFTLGVRSVHGPDHWRRVEARGVRLAAAAPGADELVVRLFAVFHDCERQDDGSDPQHGPRAARLLQEQHGDWFQIEPSQLDLLVAACRDHTVGKTSDDPTIGCCWDADRLDLPRVGIAPHRNFMSTELGRRLANQFR